MKGLGMTPLEGLHMVQRGAPGGVYLRLFAFSAFLAILP